MASIYQLNYRVDRSFPILFPLDGRKGQLAEGALGVVGSVLDLGSLSNVIDLEVGDSFFFISNPDELSGNPFAEVVAANVEEFFIDDITGTNVTLDHAWTGEPNTEDRFFEYKVLRRIPQTPFTIERVGQLDFSAAGVVLSQNGIIEVTTNTNPSGEDTLVAWPEGSLLFEPLGQERYRVTPRITVDANIEVVIPDPQQVGEIELRMTNLGLLEDLPLWAVGNDQTLWLSWLKGRMRTLEQIEGTCFADGQKGVDVQIVTAKPGDQQTQAGSQTQLLVNLVVGPREDPFSLAGATVFFDSRSLTTSEQGPFIKADIVSDGLVRVLIPANELVAGVLNCQMIIYPGGVTEDVIRTNTFTLTVL